jgi:hypothetical protein
VLVVHMPPPVVKTHLCRVGGGGGEGRGERGRGEGKRGRGEQGGCQWVL